jgi:hypothetical protein
MTLTAPTLVHYLLGRGLLTRRSIVDGDLTVIDVSRRNRNFKLPKERAKRSGQEGWKRSSGVSGETRRFRKQPGNREFLDGCATAHTSNGVTEAYGSAGASPQARGEAGINRA